ncbi:MAG: zinc ribbon domain-containing protein [Anaerolineales bacterium]
MEPADLQRLEVALWPEFDRAATLVIYRFQLSLNSVLPAVVELPIPASVGEPNAVAWQDADQTLFDAAYTLEDAGEWAIVRIELEQSRIGQLEYYSDLEIVDGLRRFRFDWPGGVEIGTLAYEVQLPVTAEELTVSPAPDRQGSGPFGLTYHFAELGPQLSGVGWAIELSYRKADAILTVEALQPLGEPAPATSGSSDASALLPWVLGGLGLAVIVGGIVYYLRSRPAPPAPRRRRSAPSQPTIEASAIFCHQCGSKAQVSDRFCRNCGTRLRTSPGHPA